MFGLDPKITRIEEMKNRSSEEETAVSGEAGVGFEPTNDGFANRCLRPLGYPAEVVVAGRSIHEEWV